MLNFGRKLLASCLSTATIKIMESQIEYHRGLLCQPAMCHQGYATPNSGRGRGRGHLALWDSSPCAVSLVTCWMGAGQARGKWRRDEGWSQLGGRKLFPLLRKLGMLSLAARSPAAWLPSPSFLPAALRVLSGDGETQVWCVKAARRVRDPLAGGFGNGAEPGGLSPLRFPLYPRLPN